MLKLDRRSLFVGAVASAAGAGGGGAAAQERNDSFGTGKKSPNVRNIRGKILNIGDDDLERGREWFSFSFREAGQITLRAF